MFTEKTKCVTLTVPKFPTTDRPDHLLIDARGVPLANTDTGYRFQDSMKVAVLGRWYQTDITFIQTDKPIYKPGQLGKYEVDEY